MQTEAIQVGKETDWAQYITLSDEHKTPLLRLFKTGPKPTEVVQHYQADVYADPRPNAQVDGQDWTTFKSAGSERRELTARCQIFSKTAATSLLAQDVAKAAGISDELAHEMTKQMTIMAREMECAMASDQVAKSDDGANGHQFRSVGAWISSTATVDADTAVDASLLPPAAQVTTTATGSQTEDNIKLILESAWSKTGSAGRKTCVLGSKAKKMFGNFQFYVPTSTSTQSTARVTQRAESDGSLGNTVDVYDSDWGTVELLMTKWNQNVNFTGGDATYTQWRSYFLNPEMWEINWYKKPTPYKIPFMGGGYKGALQAILMLKCKNPIGEGAWKPAS